jgi:hypothetical protein
MAGNIIPQAQPTGYPVYRLEWQELGSLQRRFRNCLIGMRAETYPYGAIDYIELELYMAWRAKWVENRDPSGTPIISARVIGRHRGIIGEAPTVTRFFGVELTARRVWKASAYPNAMGDPVRRAVSLSCILPARPNGGDHQT